MFLLLLKPLFPHHLVFMTVPFALLFSSLITKYKKITFITVITLILVISYNNLKVFRISDTILSSDEKKAIEIIRRNTNPEDFVVSDEAILNAESGILPPLELVDLSYVRIKSGNLTPQQFQILINKYKPKLIISWNGRLESMKDFEKIVNKNYSLLNIIGKSKKIFRLSL